MIEKKIALISDIHSNIFALEEIMYHIKDVDLIICAGDLVGYGAHPNEVIDTIKKIDRLYCVLGNHDYSCLSKDFRFYNPLAIQSLQWTIKEIEKQNLVFMKKLKMNLNIDINGFKIYIAHGSPFDNLFDYIYPNNLEEMKINEFFNLTKSDIIVLGHTHVSMLIKQKSKIIINPGSVGQPRDGNPKASVCILKIDDQVKTEFIRVSYDIDSSFKAIIDKKLPVFLGERLYKGI